MSHQHVGYREMRCWFNIPLKKNEKLLQIRGRMGDNSGVNFLSYQQKGDRTPH